jgi:hypothetical protein
MEEGEGTGRFSCWREGAALSPFPRGKLERGNARKHTKLLTNPVGYPYNLSKVTC